MNNLLKKAALMLLSLLLLASCSAGETEEDTTNETDSAVMESTEDTEDTAGSDTGIQEDYVAHRTLTVVEEDGYPYYDPDKGMFVIKFSEKNIHFTAEDTCEIGISSQGEAFVVDGTIDTTTYPELIDGDYNIGVAIKPSVALFDGTFRFVFNFSEYTLSFNYTITPEMVS